MIGSATYIMVVEDVVVVMVDLDTEDVVVDVVAIAALLVWDLDMEHGEDLVMKAVGTVAVGMAAAVAVEAADVAEDVAEDVDVDVDVVSSGRSWQRMKKISQNRLINPKRLPSLHKTNQRLMRAKKQRKQANAVGSGVIVGDLEALDLASVTGTGVGAVAVACLLAVGVVMVDTVVLEDLETLDIVVEAVQVSEGVVWATLPDQLSMGLGHSSMKDAANLTWDPKILALLIVLLMGSPQRKLLHYL